MRKMISIINYGMGNIRSVENAIKGLNFQVEVITNPNDLDSSEKIILPGVGSFKAAMKLLNEGGWAEKIKYNVLEKNKPIFGICLGMQLIANNSEEFGMTEGLNLIEGEVKSLRNLGCKIELPQIGWNSVLIKKQHKYLSGIPNITDFYFVNSFVLVPKNIEHVIAETQYDIDFCSVVAKKNIFGTQFHPEKSSKAGSKLIKNFLDA